MVTPKYLYKFKLLKLIIICLVLITTLYICYKLANDGRSYGKSNPPYIPNVVHLLFFKKKQLAFVDYICILSIFKNHNPDQLLIHSDRNLTGKYWRQLRSDYETKLTTVPLVLPTHVYGQHLSSIFHASDVARLQILLRYGGIYLDSDVFVVRPLNLLRRYEMVLQMNTDGTVGTQVILANSKAKFISLWMRSYRKYKPRMWYYNAGRRPAEILLSYPHLVHVVHGVLGTENLASLLYDNLSDVWRSYYTIHLLVQHRNYLTPEDYKRIPMFDEVNILSYNRTFGLMARSVLL